MSKRYQYPAQQFGQAAPPTATQPTQFQPASQTQQFQAAPPPRTAQQQQFQPPPQTQQFQTAPPPQTQQFQPPPPPTSAQQQQQQYQSPPTAAQQQQYQSPPTAAQQQQYQSPPTAAQQQYVTPMSGPPAAAMQYNQFKAPAPVPPAKIEWDLCAAPEYVQLTTTHFPNSKALQEKSNMVLGAVVRPFGFQKDLEEPIDVVDCSNGGITRCVGCRAYINPFATFYDNGRKWRCNLCDLPNDIPYDYYAQTDESGKRNDLDQHPELKKGSVEYIASSEYTVRPPQPPIYFFLIDTSFESISSGMLQICVDSIRACLDNLAGDERTMVGFITVNSTIQFYNIDSCLSQPQIFVIPEIDNVFIPVPNGLLVNLQESRQLVDMLLEQLPQMFVGSQETKCCLGPALKCVYRLLYQHGGKLMVFLSTMPNSGVGALKNREVMGNYGGDKERPMLLPGDPFYKDTALDLCQRQIAADLFCFGRKHMDLATLDCLPRFSSGNLYYYANFNANVHGEKFSQDLCQLLAGKVSWEAVMRIRCSKGFKVKDLFGNFFIRTSDLLMVPNVDENRSYGVTINLMNDTDIGERSVCYLQSALLFSDSDGQRRIRVHTIAARITNSLGDIYRHADIATLMNIITKRAIQASLDRKIQDSREEILNKCVSLLVTYRSSFTGPNPDQSQLLLPESLKFLPLYVLCLLKSRLLSLTGGVRADERIYLNYMLKNMYPDCSLVYLYPRMFPLHNLEQDIGVYQDGSISLPATVGLSREKVEKDGIYLLENGVELLLWIGIQCPRNLLQALFGVDTISHLSPESRLKREQGYCERVNNIIDVVRQSRPRFLQLNIVPETSPMESYFVKYLVEDRQTALLSYSEFLEYLRREIALSKPSI